MFHELNRERLTYNNRNVAISIKRTVLICPWGDQGAAYGIAGSNISITKVDAYPQNKIVDSLGK